MLIQTIWPECWFSHLTFCTASQQHGSCCLHSLSFFLHLEIVISWLIARHSMSNRVEPFCSETLLLCQSYISFLAQDVGHSYLLCHLLTIFPTVIFSTCILFHCILTLIFEPHYVANYYFIIVSLCCCTTQFLIHASFQDRITLCFVFLNSYYSINVSIYVPH